jgi:sporulation protein YlmC with PRC-barrel domain
MDSLLASDIAGDGVMTTDGIELGTIDNVLIDPRTGALESVRVSPSGAGAEGFDRNEDGQLLVPADRVRARSDYVLVDTDTA